MRTISCYLLGVLLLLGTLLPSLASAEGGDEIAQTPKVELDSSGIEFSAEICQEQATDAHIKAIGSAIIKETDAYLQSIGSPDITDEDAHLQIIESPVINKKVSNDITECFNALSPEQQAEVFLAMAEQRGLLEELQEETAANLLNEQNSTVQSRSMTPWEKVVPYNPWWWSWDDARFPWPELDRHCDGDPGDLDYRFDFPFGSAVTHPTNLRSYTVPLSPGVAAVQAMLMYYQYNGGGTVATGDYGSRIVHSCLGTTGVAVAGGPWNVVMHMALRK